MACIAHWKMNDNAATTTVADSVGSYDADFIDEGTALTSDHTVSGIVNAAFDFDGTNDYIDTGDAFASFGQADFSISVWVKPDDGRPASDTYILGSIDAGSTQKLYLALLSTGKIEFTYEANDKPVIARENAASFSNGTQSSWTHIVGTADADTALKIYVNGTLSTLDASYPGDASALTFADFLPINDIFISGYNNDDTMASAWKGLIDNVMFFDSTLIQAEVNILHRSGAGTEDSGLTTLAGRFTTPRRYLQFIR